MRLLTLPDNGFYLLKAVLGDMHGGGAFDVFIYCLSNRPAVSCHCPSSLSLAVAITSLPVPAPRCTSKDVEENKRVRDKLNARAHAYGHLFSSMPAMV